MENQTLENTLVAVDRTFLKQVLVALMRAHPHVKRARAYAECSYGSNFSEHRCEDTKEADNTISAAIITLRQILALDKTSK